MESTAEKWKKARFMYPKSYSCENIVSLCNNSAKIFQIWNHGVLINLTDLKRKEAEFNDIFAIENVRLGTVKY